MKTFPLFCAEALIPAIVELQKINSQTRADAVRFHAMEAYRIVSNDSMDSVFFTSTGMKAMNNKAFTKASIKSLLLEVEASKSVIAKELNECTRLFPDYRLALIEKARVAGYKKDK